ncbi:Vacuolar protein sorting-associated protein 8 [Lobosporangium transversale]|uniref:Golgi CORVET complex core vacuolar protein 8-domain-containing protein n=1 Tax=Lobosporangium transversale TaxID=64571 RepID=A0A1Y2GAC6_9FUNG|nr:Golgi CORVET complex core vacuolar protein 8-domain-containing protein [Lobosporangium transversale]KAF9919403.1 Vacuolar protein sorting-associated protein 8 [Lobosporangium transversale]ORZ04540.1 Golgi CORVET complex core vacuolar protein 8-domain-containing protein [Lobosporangium transversale]|eukprot:XP_021876586.1 Golgi CORVET complex core vacuolar protein 8-domain-containing protein [Lobosporangium transversale]
MSTPGAKHSTPSTQDEYEALLKEILESDSSSDEGRSRRRLFSKKQLSLSSSCVTPDLDLDFDLDLNRYSYTDNALQKSNFAKSLTKNNISNSNSNSNSDKNNDKNSNNSSSSSSQIGATANPIAGVSIVVGEDLPDNVHFNNLSTSNPSDAKPSLLSSALIRPQPLLSLSAPSSSGSSPSSSVNTFTRASSIVSSSSKHSQNYRSPILLLDSLPNKDTSTHLLPSLDAGVSLEHTGYASIYFSNRSSKSQQRSSVTDNTTRKCEVNQQHKFRRYNRQSSSLLKFVSKMDIPSLLVSGAQQHERASQWDGRNSSSSRPTNAPIILKGSNTRLVNGLQSITSLEQKFNELRIPELELLSTPETTIRAVLADIYKISEELHMHLQGGALADAPQPTRRDGDGIIISGETQRQKRIKEIIDRIDRETSLYEEFVRKSNYLNLDAILNEASDEDDEELQGFAGLDRSISERDSVSDFHHEDAQSQTSFMSSNNYGHIGTNPHSSPPLSTLSLRSADPINRLRPYTFSPRGPGSVASSSALAGARSHISSISLPITAPHHSDSYSPRQSAGAEPWETFRWTPLLKLSDQLFSEEIKASSGLGTCIAVSSIIAVGTSRGSVLVYSTTQALIGIYGSAQYAMEHGAVCSIAISTDNTYLVAGHSLGSIIIWNINKPNTPSRIIPPVTKEMAFSGRKHGHLRGSAVLNVAFIGIKRAEVISADNHGMAFHHLLYKTMMVNAVETTRLLGKYPVPKPMRAFESNSLVGTIRQSTVFSMGVLPYGQVPHPADSAGLVALLTPFKLLIVCMKPQPQTVYKFLRPKDLQGKSEEPPVVISGNLAWFPATKIQNAADNDVANTNPLLAYSWNRHLYILQVCKRANQSAEPSSTYLSPDKKPVAEPTSKELRLEFAVVGDWICREGIVGIQWVRSQILLLLTNTEDIIVFDPKTLSETERCSARSLQIVYHDWFKDVAKTHRTPAAATMTIMEDKQLSGDMYYNNSWRVHKGKLFVLGLRRVQVGTILNWTDRILALVKSGDFLEGIALATLFYIGKSVQAAVVGLPEDEAARKQLVGEKIYELLTASLNYTFNPERMTDVDDDAAAGGVGAGTVLFHDLAIQAIESCLAIEDQRFLFEDVYERYAEASPLVRGIFLQSLSGYILQDRLTEMPPQVMQDFVKNYCERGMFKELELCICHTSCEIIEMDHIVDICQRHKLYTGLIYVWNKSIGDYVSPVIELLKVIKGILKERRLAREARAGARNQGTLSSSNSAPLVATEDLPHYQAEPSNEEVVQKLYQYLSDSLLGKSYVDGVNLEESEAITAKSSLYSFIFSGRCIMWPPVGGQLILTGDADDDSEDSEPTYPYLRLFLRHNSEEFLKVLDLAFEDSYLSTTSKSLSQSGRNGQEGPGRLMSRQLIINTLLEVVSPSTSPFTGLSSTEAISNSSQQIEYTARDIAHVYSFIARNYAKSHKTLVLSPTTLHRILTKLSSDTDEATREKRQVAVQALLRFYSPGDETGMMALYEQARFYRVLEKMYRSQKQYGPMVATFLKDPERRSHVFECIRKLLDSSRPQRTVLTEKQRTDVVKTTMEHIADIVDIDGEQAALLVHKYLNGEHRSVMETLHGSKPRLFAYLRGLLEPSVTYAQDQSKLQNMTATDISNREYSTIGASSITDPEIHEEYIELLCQYDPSGVYDYLERHQDNSYRLERVLKTCENAGVVDAVVWILERSGNVGGALGKVLEIVRERIDVLSALVRSKNDGAIQDIHWSMEEQINMRACLVRLRGVLNVGKQLCERRSQKVKLLSQAAKVPLQQNLSAESDTETLWFRLLQVFVSATRKMTILIATKRPSIEVKVDDNVEVTHSSMPNALIIENAPPSLFSNTSQESRTSYYVVDQLLSNFKGFVQSILATLLLSTSTPQVSLPSLLRRLLKSESADEGELNRFSDFKDIFMGMLNTFKYEGQLLEMTNGLFERDLFMGVNLIAKSRSKGWRPLKGNCEICGGAFWGPNVVRDLWVQQQKAAVDAIKAALATNVILTERQEGSTLDASESEASAAASTSSPRSELKHSATLEQSKDKSKDKVDKGLLIFRCGHGYHHQCLEMETAGVSPTAVASSRVASTQQQEVEVSKHKGDMTLLETDSTKAPKCVVCSGLIQSPKSKLSSRPSGVKGPQTDATHQRHASRSSRQTSKNIKKGWTTVELLQRSASHPVAEPTSGRTPPPQNSSNNANGIKTDGAQKLNLKTSSQETVQYHEDQDDRRHSPDSEEYYMTSNEYEAATSPSMKASFSNGKGKAIY